MKLKLTKRQAQEVLHKMGVLSDTPDLQDDYGITQKQADDLCASVPHNGGTWTPPAWAKEVVRGELEDAAIVCRNGLGDSARSDGDVAGALSEYRLGSQIQRLAAAL